jgi:hypothetical protein
VTYRPVFPPEVREFWKDGRMWLWPCLSEAVVGVLRSIADERRV